MTGLEPLDIRTALAAVEFWRSAHRLSRLPVPPALDRTAANLLQLANAARVRDLEAVVAFKRQEDVVPQPQWLTTDQVADRMGCSLSSALRLARRLGHRVGRIWLTPADAITED